MQHRPLRPGEPGGSHHQHQGVIMKGIQNAGCLQQVGAARRVWAHRECYAVLLDLVSCILNLRGVCMKWLGNRMHEQHVGVACSAKVIGTRRSPSSTSKASA